MGIFKPKTYMAQSPKHNSIEPSNVKATLLPLWKHSMQSKFDALVKNEIWTLVPAPSDRIVISHKWNF